MFFIHPNKTCRAIFTIIAAGFLLMAHVSCHSDRTVSPRKDIDRDKSISTLAELDSVKKILSQNPYDINSNVSLWDYYLSKGMVRDVIESADPLFHRAISYQDSAMMLYAGSYLSESYLRMEKFDSIYVYMKSIMPLVIKDSTTHLSAKIHNMEAIRDLKCELNYTAALTNFKTALDIEKSRKDSSRICQILCNISRVYLARNDTSGISYVKEAYDISRKSKDKYMITHSLILLGEHYLVMGDYQKAMDMAEKATEEYTRHGIHAFEPQVNLLKGDIYFAEGDGQKAYGCYKKGLELLDISSKDIQIKLYLSLGNYYISIARYQKAIDYLTTALKYSYACNTVESRLAILLSLSEASYNIGNEKKALEYYKEYHHLSDSIYLFSKERDFNNLLLKYEKTSHENDIREKELTVAKANRNTVIILLIAIIILGFFIALYILYRKKNEMYKQMFDQYQYYLQRTESLKSVEHSEDSGGDSREDEEEREKFLFIKLEELMEKDQIYKMTDLTLDKIADMLKTNRTYVSKVINKYAATSFYGYLNYLRVKEAVRILSTEGDNTPLKELSVNLGYKSISTFYQAFQKETGCPPSKFREQLRRNEEK